MNLPDTSSGAPSSVLSVLVESTETSPRTDRGHPMSDPSSPGLTASSMLTPSAAVDSSLTGAASIHHRPPNLFLHSADALSSLSVMLILYKVYLP